MLDKYLSLEFKTKIKTMLDSKIVKVGVSLLLIGACAGLFFLPLHNKIASQVCLGIEVAGALILGFTFIWRK